MASPGRGQETSRANLARGASAERSRRPRLRSSGSTQVSNARVKLLSLKGGALGVPAVAWVVLSPHVASHEQPAMRGGGKRDLAVCCRPPSVVIAYLIVTADCAEKPRSFFLDSVSSFNTRGTWWNTRAGSCGEQIWQRAFAEVGDLLKQSNGGASSAPACIQRSPTAATPRSTFWSAAAREVEGPMRGASGAAEKLQS